MELPADRRVIASAAAILVGSTLSGGITESLVHLGAPSALSLSQYAVSIYHQQTERLSVDTTFQRHVSLTEQERASIGKLVELSENWDGFGSAKPNATSIRNALSLVEELFDIAVSTRFGWLHPHISASEEGDVVLEWWRGAHKLTVYVSSNSSEYIKVWGPDIVHEMSDGVLSNDSFEDLWNWLHAQDATS